MVGVVAFGGALTGGPGDASGRGSTATVRRGDLVITVTEGGSLRAKESIDIINEVEGRSTIAEVVEEGAQVTKDQVILRLDAKELEERKAQEEATLRTIIADVEASELNLQIQKDEARSKIAEAERNVRFAQIDLDKYTQGDWPQKVREAEADIVLAEEEHRQAQQTLEGTIRLVDAGAAAPQQIETDRLTLQRKAINLEHARKKLELMKQYEHPKELARLEADLTEARRELDRVKKQMQSNIALKEASLASAKDRLAIRQAAYDKLVEQLEKSVVRAPQTGLLVYEEPPRWRSEQAIAVGTEVRFRQRLFKLPDLSVMEVDVSIHETLIDRVQPGQKASIVVDAYPDRQLTGRVQKINVMADNQRWFNPDVKVYKTVVSIEGDVEGLKPGMTAQVEILCEVVKDQLLVPVTGVHLVNGRTAAFVRIPGDIVVREVEVGQTNDQHTIVLSGLAEGDEVLLYPPENMPAIPWTEPEKTQPTEAEPEQPMPAPERSDDESGRGGERRRPNAGTGAGGGRSRGGATQ